MTANESTPAILGGIPAVDGPAEDVFKWPVFAPAAEQAVVELMRNGNISGLDVTRQFESEFARWIGAKYALAHTNGTAAIHCGLFGIGVGAGDEIICPAMTYWASCAPVFSLGGTVAFADIDPETLCIDPADIEHRISERTKAIMVVHYAGMPADMDAILGIARKHDISVIEDCSHSHGTLYKGKITGSFGDVAAFSLMSQKSFPVGEGGMLVTNERRILERAIAFGHYARHAEYLTLPGLRENAGVPWGGYKYRINQIASTIGREQLRTYPDRMKEIDDAMNYFWDLLDDVPGIRAHRPAKGSGSTKGGWYNPLGLYRPEDLEGLSITRFCEAVRAEGFRGCEPGCNRALNTHPLFTALDVYGSGRPTRFANLPAGTDTRPLLASCPISEKIQSRTFRVPWFKKMNRPVIESYAAAFRKVAGHHEALLPGDSGNPETMGSWGTSTLTR